MDRYAPPRRGGFRMSRGLPALAISLLFAACGPSSDPAVTDALGDPPAA